MVSHSNNWARNQEVEVVRVTLVVLFLSLVIVYAAYFQMNGGEGNVALNENSGIITETGSLPDDKSLNTLSSFDLLERDEGDSTITEGEGAPDVIPDSTLSNLAALGESGFSVNVDDLNASLENTIDDLISDTLKEVSDKDEEQIEIIGEEIVDASISEEDPTSMLLDLINTESGDEEILNLITNKEETSGIKILDGTKEFYGDIDALQVLGLDHQYILTDGEAYFAYLGEGDYNFASLARALGGNVVEIVTEIDIVKNDLFGEKIAFVNIPGVTYTTIPVEQRQIVFMIVWWNNDRRLIQVDYASYHRLKPIMAQRFSSLYEGSN